MNLTRIDWPILHAYPSEMAQNFWPAIWAWTTCFVVTIFISLLTRARDEKELVGLVYSLTERPSEEQLPWLSGPPLWVSPSLF